MNEIQINDTIEKEVTTTVVTQVSITRARTTLLAVAFAGFAYLAIEYIGSDDSIVKKRFFKVSGAPFDSNIDQVADGTIRNVLQANADDFAMALIATPAMIDGVDIVELDGAEFIQDFYNNIVE